MNSFIPTYRDGTHRLASPEETLRRIESHLIACGITRCADVTRLDALQLPTYCAIRPGAQVLQTANGKGVTPASAKVSALMEAIECHHSENPALQSLRRASQNAIRASGESTLEPQTLDGFRQGFFTDDFIIEWTKGIDLVSGADIWVPSSSVFFGREPALHDTSSNGLASGNHLLEATLHALYELIERDAGSRLSVDGRLKIRERCKVIDLPTITEPHLAEIITTLGEAQSKLVLLSVESCIPVHTFWAVLLNKSAFSSGSTFNIGWGTHLDASVAASRAITEAIQARLTFIHGAREDLATKPVSAADAVSASPAFRYFDALEATAAWSDVGSGAPVDYNLEKCLTYLIRELTAAGHQKIVQCDLTLPGIGIPVVKVLVPSLRFHKKLF